MKNISPSEDLQKLQHLKEQGRQYLRENQIDKALRIFSRILNEYPQDIDSMLILGDAYLVINERQSALSMYQDACRVNPERRDIQRRVDMLIGDETKGDANSSPLPTTPRAVAGLIQRLTGRATPVSEEEVIKAGSFLNNYLQSSSPALSVADHLEEIDTLLPALIEINIRQARADGKTDLASSLQDMLANVLLQIDLQSESLESQPGIDSDLPSTMVRVALAGTDTYESPYRMIVLVDTLSEAGYFLIKDVDPKSQAWKENDLLIARNPHANQELMRGVASRAASGKPVLVDFDLDYEMIPTTHPDYEKLGLTSIERVRGYQAALQLADVVSVPSEGAAELFRSKVESVEILPDGWSKQNPLWLRSPPGRLTFNIGLNLLRGQMEDVAPVRRAVIRTLREFPHTRLVVYGDLEVYQLFDSVPEARKVLLPPVDVDDYPYMLGHMDILLLPYYDTAFNQMRSDRRLMEAGIRHIPWVASPLSAHLMWGSGGLVAYTLDEWYTNIQSLVQDEELRVRLAKAGFQKALLRESQVWTKAWRRAIQKTLAKSGSRKET